jgi:hypothetical protein
VPPRPPTPTGQDEPGTGKTPIVKGEDHVTAQLPSIGPRLGLIQSSFLVTGAAHYFYKGGLWKRRGLSR